MRFAPIVKIRKQALDNLENEMAKLNLAIVNTQDKIMSLHNELNSTKKPSSGVIAEFLAIQRIIDAYKLDIESQTARLRALEFNKQELAQKLKLAHMELEKIKYLEEQENLAKLARLKRIEAANLDEVGLILYNNRKTS